MSSNAAERAARAKHVRKLIERDAFYLAVPLHAYTKSRGMDWAALALSLGCTTDELNRIACCRPPRPEHFAEDASYIAGIVHADEVRFINLLREIEVSKSFIEWVAESGASYETEADRELEAYLREVQERDESEEGKADEEDRPSHE